MGGYTGQELAYGQRHDQPHVVLAGNRSSRADAPEFEKWTTVHGDGEQLYHRHRGWERERIEDHFAYHIVAAADYVPQDTQCSYRKILPGLLLHSSRSRRPVVG